MGAKTHNYTQRTPAIHYVLESAKDEIRDAKDETEKFYMTAHGSGIKPQDYIVLRESADTVKYQVEKIDYYCGTPDYWIALLIKCPL